MQSEADWLSRQDAEYDSSKERYEYFMTKEPREELSGIYEIDDPYLGPRTKVRDVRIGMVRNAKDENKKAVLAYLSPYPHCRIDAAKPLQGWYQSKVNESKQSRPRPCFSEALLTEPYGGWCAISCQFCYINSGIRGYRGTGLITVPMNYGEQIRRQLASIRRGAAGYFSSFTDPFTPLEDYYHNTEEAVNAFVEVGLPIFFLSRLRYPDWAVDLLTRNPHSYAQKSINTSDPDDWRKLSPGALGYHEHLADIARIKARGIYVSIQVNPIIPGVTSLGQIKRLFRDLRGAGADHVIVKFVEAGYSWAPAMVERMIKRFGDRGRRFEELFTQNIGAERTVDEAYRMNAHDSFSRWAKEYGLTYSTCYEYEYQRDAAGRVLSKTGVSVGRKFATSAQCHGQRVPVYARSSGDEPFRPLEECPPSGCLYCAEENETDPGKPRCGDELAGQAAALTLADLRKPIGTGRGRAWALPMLDAGPGAAPACGG